MVEVSILEPKQREQPSTGPGVLRIYARPYQGKRDLPSPSVLNFHGLGNHPCALHRTVVLLATVEARASSLRPPCVARLGTQR